MDEFHSPYVVLSIRILVNSADMADIKEVNALQDKFTINADSARPYSHPIYDQASYKETYEALLELSRGLPDARRMFGKKEEVGEVRHLKRIWLHKLKKKMCAKLLMAFIALPVGE